MKTTLEITQVNEDYVTWSGLIADSQSDMIKFNHAHSSRLV